MVSVQKKYSTQATVPQAISTSLLCIVEQQFLLLVRQGKRTALKRVGSSVHSDSTSGI